MNSGPILQLDDLGSRMRRGLVDSDSGLLHGLGVCCGHGSPTGSGNQSVDIHSSLDVCRLVEGVLLQAGVAGHGEDLMVP